MQIPSSNEMAVLEKEKAYTGYHFSVKYNSVLMQQRAI